MSPANFAQPEEYTSWERGSGSRHFVGCAENREISRHPWPISSSPSRRQPPGSTRRRPQWVVLTGAQGVLSCPRSDPRRKIICVVLLALVGNPCDPKRGFRRTEKPVRFVRLATVLFQFAALVSCLLFCGPADSLCHAMDSHSDAPADTPCDSEPIGDPCGQSGDTCICRGATMVSKTQIEQGCLDGAGAGPASDAVVLVPPRVLPPQNAFPPGSASLLPAAGRSVTTLLQAFLI